MFTYLSHIAITATKIVVFVQAFCIDFLKYFYIFFIRQYSSFKCYHKVCLRDLEFHFLTGGLQSRIIETFYRVCSTRKFEKKKKYLMGENLCPTDENRNF